MKRLLLLYAREPAAGRVKTRLAASIGAEKAAALYAAFLLDLAPALESRGWTFRVASDAALPAPGLAAIFAGREIVAQPEGDLGARLARSFFAARAEGFAQVSVAGSDAPLLSAEDVRGAFRALDGASEAAVAPAPDGGFSLVALRAGVDADALFRGVRWSSRHALADTRANAAASGLHVALLPEVPDVDVAADLDVLRVRLRERPGAAPATARLLLAWEAA